MTELRIRAAIASDAAALEQFMEALQNTERAFHASRSDGATMAAAHLAYLRQVAQTHQGGLWVAERAHRPVGFLVGWVETLDEGDRHVLSTYRQYGYVSDLYVAPGDRRQGVSRALLQAAAHHFRQLGLVSMRLSTLCANDLARLAYENLGFAPYEITYELSLR